jgi:hypothetical protein
MIRSDSIEMDHSPGANFPCRSRFAKVASPTAEDMDLPMNDKIEATERNDQDLLAFDMADEALEAAAEKSKPAFTLVGSPTVSVLVACCG